MSNPTSPPLSSFLREMIDARVADAENTPGERVTVELRGERVHLPVITVPIGALWYNPRTHRVRAQLEFFPQAKAKVETDPWSSEAQEALGNLLKMRPAEPQVVDNEYKRLKDSVAQGQREPGIITRDGVLANGNTRRLALMEISGPETNMRVAVLPASADWTDIADIELALQMADDHRRDYSWINRLVAIDELMAQGTPSGVIAAKFGSTREMVEREHWIYAVILSMVERSRHGENALSLISFEEKAEHLRELARYDRKLSATDPRAAEVATQTRIAATALDFSKTDVRFVDEKFFQRYLLDELPPDVRAGGDGAPIEIPGLGGVTVAGPPALAVSARALATAALQARAEGVTSFRFRQLRQLMSTALDRAGRDNRIRKKTTAAPDRLRDVAANLHQAGVDVGQARATRTLDVAEVDAALGEMRVALRGLAGLLAREPEPGENVRWLLGLLRQEEAP